MHRTAVVYSSKYGSAERYAHWLAHALDAELLPAQGLTPQALEHFDTLLMGGGVYAGGVAGLKLLQKHPQLTQGRRVAVFAVGASPFEASAVENLRRRLLPGALQRIPLFYLRGAYDESRMSLPDRTLCRILRRSLERHPPEHPEPWMTAMLECGSRRADWTDPAALQPLIDFVRNC